MKATVVAVFAALLAVAATTEMPDEGPYGQCPPVDGEKPVYLMDKWYRDVFYECTNGRPMRQTCPERLVFNPRKNVCGFPCIDCEPYGPVGSCPRDDADEYPLTYLRDGVDISVYYLCWRKYDTLMGKCEKGRYFDMIEKICNVLPKK